MKDENPSVEDLLKSLRKTLSKKEENEEDILHLTKPMRSQDANNPLVDFIEEIIQREIKLAIKESKDTLLRKAIEDTVARSKHEMHEILHKVINNYVEANATSFYSVIRESIEKKIEQMIKSS